MDNRKERQDRNRSLVRGTLVWPALLVGLGLPLLLVGLMLNATVALIVFLVMYALAGAMFGFNLWGASDRAAESFRGEAWPLRQIGRDNPMLWLAGGLMMLTFGVIVILWILVLAKWQLPEIRLGAALGILVATAVVCVLPLIRFRQKRANGVRT